MIVLKERANWGRHCIKNKLFYLISGEKIFTKRTVSAEFWANYRKICGNCPFTENLLTRKLGRKAYLLHGEITYICFETNKNCVVFFTRLVWYNTLLSLQVYVICKSSFWQWEIWFNILTLIQLRLPACRVSNIPQKIPR